MEKVGKRGDVRAAFSLGLEGKHQYGSVTFLSCSLTVKGIVHPKLKFYLFIVHHFVDVGFGDIFLIHLTVIEFHRCREFHPMEAYGSHGLH